MAERRSRAGKEGRPTRDRGPGPGTRGSSSGSDGAEEGRTEGGADSDRDMDDNRDRDRDGEAGSDVDGDGDRAMDGDRDRDVDGDMDRDIDVRAIALFGAGLGLTLIVVIPAVFALSALFRAADVARDPMPSPLAAANQPRVPPPPRLQPAPRSDMEILRRDEQAVLTSYGWVDRRRGVGRIPVDRAMEILLEKGLPSAPPPATPGGRAAPPASHEGSHDRRPRAQSGANSRPQARKDQR